MSIMKLTHNLIIAYVSVIGLSACGGGGSNDNTPQPVVTTPPVVTLATIDRGNETKIMRVAMVATLGPFEFAGFADLTGSTAGVQPDAMAATAKVAQGTLRRDNVSYIPIGTEASQCAVSGSQTVSGGLPLQRAISSVLTPTCAMTATIRLWMG